MSRVTYKLTINCEAQEPGYADREGVFRMAASAASDDPDNAYGVMSSDGHYTAVSAEPPAEPDQFERRTWSPEAGAAA